MQRSGGPARPCPAQHSGSFAGGVLAAPPGSASLSRPQPRLSGSLLAAPLLAVAILLPDSLVAFCGLWPSLAALWRPAFPAALWADRPARRRPTRWRPDRDPQFCWMPLGRPSGGITKGKHMICFDHYFITEYQCYCKTKCLITVRPHYLFKIIFQCFESHFLILSSIGRLILFWPCPRLMDRFGRRTISTP